jgi:phosphoglycolate phosphatase-like HAD superfamily hydrolase
MRLRTFLFDLDGTLIDHLPAIHRCYSYALPKLGYPAPTFEQVRNAIGGGLPKAMGKFVPPERVEEALAIYRPHWDETLLDGVSLLPGVELILRDLKARGFQTAVFTNKHGPSARKLCDHLELTPWLDDVVGADDTAWLKPASEFNAWMLDRLGAKDETTCLIGDSPYDVAAAQASGWDFYGVTTGTHTAAELQAAGATNVRPDLPSWAREWGLAGGQQ